MITTCFFLFVLYIVLESTKGTQTNERTKKLLYGLVWRSGFRSEDADPCGVYRYEPVDPADRTKGYKAIYQYSLKEDFNKFSNHEAVYFVEKK